MNKRVVMMIIKVNILIQSKVKEEMEILINFQVWEVNMDQELIDKRLLLLILKDKVQLVRQVQVK